MNYIVMEIQTMDNGTIATLVTTKNSHNEPLTENEAESTYHSILAAAALSNLPCHAAVMMTGEGIPLQNRCYKHETPVEE